MTHSELEIGMLVKHNNRLAHFVGFHQRSRDMGTIRYLDHQFGHNGVAGSNDYFFDKIGRIPVQKPDGKGGGYFFISLGDLTKANEVIEQYEVY